MIKAGAIEQANIEQKAIERAYDIFARIAQKQGRMLPFRNMYGDGTRFSPLNRKGARLVYDAIIETLEESFEIPD